MPIRCGMLGDAPLTLKYTQLYDIVPETAAGNWLTPQRGLQKSTLITKVCKTYVPAGVTIHVEPIVRDFYSSIQ